MSEKQFPLSLVIRAVDKATGPLRAMTARINAATGPLAGLGKDFGKLGEALNVQGFMKVGSAMRNVGGEVFGLAARFAGLGLAAGLAVFTIGKGALEAGDRLAEMADRVGLSVDAYASLQHAAAQADVDQESFNGAMDKLNKNLGDMTVGKGGKFLAFLNQISPTFAKQVKGAKGTEEAFSLITEAISKIPDPARRATLAAAAFGKSNTQFGAFLSQGNKSIAEQRKRFMELAGSQEASARAAGELDNASRETGVALLGLRQAAAGGLFPALTRLAKIATKFLAGNRESIAKWANDAGNAIDAWVNSGGLNRLVQSFREIAAAAMKVVEFLGPVGTVAAAAAVFMGPLIMSIGSLGMALIGVIPQVYALGAAFLSTLPVTFPFIIAAVGIAALGKTIYDNWEPLVFIFEDWGNSLRWAVVDTWAKVRPILEKLAAFGIFPGALAAGDFVSGQVMNAIDARRPAVSAAQAMGGRSVGNPAAMAAQNARVSIDIKGLPAGSRVVADPNSTADLDLSSGYMSVQP